MTEAEWLTCDGSADVLLQHLFKMCRPSQRQLRLYVCAKCRHTRYLTASIASARYLVDNRIAQQTIEVGERYADGAATEEERLLAFEPTTRGLDGELAAYGDRSSALAARQRLAARQCVVSRVSSSKLSSGEDEELDPQFRPAILLRDIFGNPFRPVAFSPAWRTSIVVALAAQMYESRDFSTMPILADALQDAGCDNADMLDHCRGPGPHVRGCWVVDLVLGKE
ncbi:Uncharacterized protein OS=Sorangium cellulosum (strain So ce56) GN=sce5710 PE=4 SV=1 [Gemmata massiliana]|uniref:Uncharacterized protein n=1 Tax=Gemmata massiliana TaxID=1210884 RepID=A0A6P2D639_9BACT|nr:Uncharacterized protein OS=Sorangium cellulosum (strain So ce56) GN=sce5710 PE=4 SV=1 [Gemmata massiliana]